MWIREHSYMCFQEIAEIEYQGKLQSMCICERNMGQQSYDKEVQDQARVLEPERYSSCIITLIQKNVFDFQKNPSKKCLKTFLFCMEVKVRYVLTIVLC